MHHDRPSIAFFAPELPGHVVVAADGEELGVVEQVVQPSHDGNDTAHGHHLLVVKLEHELPDVASDAVAIPDDTVHAVTDEAVVLGTTTHWLAQQGLVQPAATDSHQP